jgi:hypothetical protein
MTQQVNINRCTVSCGGSDVLPYGVDKFTEGQNQYEAYVGDARIPFEAPNDEEAIQKGHMLIIEKVKEVVEKHKDEKSPA